MAARKRTGRPLKDHPPGTMVTISLQIPAELKAQLQQEAMAADRTLSQEAERRLQRSLDPDSLWEDAFAEVTGRAYAKSRQRRRRQELLAMKYALKSLAEELGRQIEKFEKKESDNE